MKVRLIVDERPVPARIFVLLDLAGAEIISVVGPRAASVSPPSSLVDVDVLVLPDENSAAATVTLISEQSSGTALVVLSSDSSSEVRTHHLLAGADAHLDLGIEPEELRARFDAILRRRRRSMFPITYYAPKAYASG